MADLFHTQAKFYAETRPGYPTELFQFIASKTPNRQLAWDVGTGSGQAAVTVLSLSLSPRLVMRLTPSSKGKTEDCFSIHVL